MNAIMRNLKSLPGVLLSLLVMLIILFWVLSIASKSQGIPVVGGAVSGAATWAEQHAKPY